MTELNVEGNNGGDVLIITDLDNGLLKLKVGHQCVYEPTYIVPIEFITTALAQIMQSEGGIEEFIKNIGWDKKFTNSLLKKVKRK